MKVREVPLPPDLQYVLDGGVEGGHITGGCHAALFLFGDIAELDRVHSIPHPELRGWAATAAMCTEVEAYGQRVIAQIDDPDLKAAVLGSTTSSFLYALSQFAEYICNQSYEDAIWGGCMEHRHADRIDRFGRVHKRLDRCLRSDAHVKRACRLHHGEADYQHLVNLRRVIGSPLPPATAAGFELLNITFAGQRERRAERDRAWIDAERRKAPAESRPAMRPITKQRRRTTIRAAAVASAILGSATVSAFARGEPVRLPADSLTVEVSLGGRVWQSGHSAVKVTLKGDGDTYLAQMCIYQKGLPALDQLASLALHVQAGGVADVIAAGNLFNLAPDAFAHPLLAGKKMPERVPGGPPVFNPLAGDFENRRAMVLANEEAMGDRFRQRLFVEVLGREAPAAWATFQRFREGILA